MLDGTLDGSDALVVGTGANLAENTLLVVVLEPLGSNGETLSTDGGADAGLVGAGAVRVEVLVHLVEELLAGGIRRISQVLESVAGAALDPVPGTRVRVTLDPDVLGRGTRSTDVGDGGLVQVVDQRVVHVVVLVVGVEDDLLVVLETSGNGLPPGSEVGAAGDDVAVVAAVVVGIDDGVGAPIIVSLL